jgi:hypothetical protein
VSRNMAGHEGGMRHGKVRERRKKAGGMKGMKGMRQGKGRRKKGMKGGTGAGMVGLVCSRIFCEFGSEK